MIKLELIEKLKNGLIGDINEELGDVDEEDFDFDYEDDFETWCLSMKNRKRHKVFDFQYWLF